MLFERKLLGHIMSAPTPKNEPLATAPAPSPMPQTPTPTMSGSSLPSMDMMSGGGGLPSADAMSEQVSNLPPEARSALVGSGSQGAAMIDQLPPGSETAARLCQNPIVAGVVSALSPMTGTPVSPTQVMQGAKIGEVAIKARGQEKEREESLNKGPSM